MNSKTDLRQLKVDRTSTLANEFSPPRHWFARYVVPGGILLGFAILLGWATRDKWRQSTPVQVVPVVVTRAAVQPDGRPVFQTPGWVEPRPTSVLVSALTEGVIEDLLVVEGQDVEAGQPVARLIKADAELSVQRAEAQLELREAELAEALAEVAASLKRLEAPVHLEASLADADSELAKAETELARLPFELTTAQTRLRFLNGSLEGKQSAGDAVSERLLLQAETERDSATALVEQLLARKPQLELTAQALRRKQEALARQLELKIEETRQAAAAEAKRDAALARVREAKVSVDQAHLRLDRTVVIAPVSGRVLQLVARPGARVMGLAPHSAYDSSTVITLYDPQRLQVRADVRLEDVPMVQPGQPVRIETSSADLPIEGEVLMATSRANIQKNTLEVKVAIHAAPPTIRPEMLVKVTFFSVEQPDRGIKPSGQPERIAAPRELIREDHRGSFVWLADPAGLARRQRVELGGTLGTHPDSSHGGKNKEWPGDLEPALEGDLVEVVDGLSITDRLISVGLERLEDGQRIRIVSEDHDIHAGN